MNEKINGTNNKENKSRKSAFSRNNFESVHILDAAEYQKLKNAQKHLQQWRMIGTDDDDDDNDTISIIYTSAHKNRK